MTIADQIKRSTDSLSDARFVLALALSVKNTGFNFVTSRNDEGYRSIFGGYRKFTFIDCSVLEARVYL